MHLLTQMANANTLQADHHERKLLELAKAGNELAIDQLARTHWPGAYRAALRIMHSHEDAEEVAQDSLWAAIKHLPTFREDACFRTWLYRIVINHGVMALRRKRSQRRDSTSPLRLAGLSGFSNVPPTPEELLLEAECVTVVEEGLSRLPDCYAIVLQLVAREDPSTLEIANRVGISASAVKSRLHRGRRELHLEISRRLSVSRRGQKDPPDGAVAA
jgi:RNA polymerase sigma-70 factor, ECF subfamily